MGDTLKVADLSIIWGQGEISIPDISSSSASFRKPVLSHLRIFDNVSSLDRFNQEKAWVEFLLTRIVTRPRALLGRGWLDLSLLGLMKGVHTDFVYKTLEGAVEGVIDFKLEEVGDDRKTLMGIRVLRNVGFDGKWYQLKVNDEFEVTLDK